MGVKSSGEGSIGGRDIGLLAGIWPKPMEFIFGGGKAVVKVV